MGGYAKEWRPDLLRVGDGGNLNHLGILVNVEKGFINTIEGNRSNKAQRGRYMIGNSSIYEYGV